MPNSLFGIGFATQKDTLFKYLEKAPKADWEIVWHDGIERTALQNGDILKITAENGDSKEYYIKVWGYRPSHNAALSAITWPDIPNDLRGLFGWKGDTIPGFSSSVYNYKISIPAESDGIPALVAKTQQLNSKIKVDRATSFSGSVEQRTISFTVTAEDGITQRIYDVVIEKEKSFENTQPYIAEPFLSELVFREQFGNGFIEICNPGNQPLDLSDYMMYFGYDNNPANAAANYSGEANWGIRYRKYIPGYKWVDEMNWAMAPGRVEKDVNVNSIVYPGDVFVMGHITRTNTSGYPWWASEACDIDFGHLPGETYSNASSAASMWYNTNFHIFKILNDSIKLGLKPANDPNDFELIETWGGGDGRPWVVGGYTPGNQITSWIRKPEFHKGVTEYKGSFGTNADDSQWLMVDRAYFTKLGMGYPANILAITSDLGQHFMHEVTSYKSTVTSTVYKVSPGYSMNESIRGMKTGTTVGEFLTNIIKADDNQTLLVKNVNDGSELTGDALLSLNDTLIVLSADSVNTSKYILNVGQGLSSDAVLTSNKYEIIIDVQPVSGDEYIPGIGSISGFEYGTQLKTVLANIQKPRGATLSVIDDEGAYVPIRILNFDTTYVMATVNHNIFIEVVAEDGLTKIVYQLKPDVSQNTAFVLSDVYFVSQKDLLIDLVPRGSSVTSLLKNLIPSLGASIKLVDKLGHERTVGQIVQDDKIVVTSPNGMVTTVYYLSLLHDEYLKSSDYLAYILSNVYVVDQEAYTVNEVSGTETIAEFYSRIRTAKGATAVVVDKDGMGKTSGSISGSDMVKVTSADGKMVVMYKFGPLVSAPTVKANNIQLYPNPTTGKISISGVTLGNRIQVFNLVGSSIRDLRVTSSIESISLDKEPAGIYMIVVTENSRTLGHFKVIKK